MIDRPARTIAARLIAQFRAGELTNDDLEARWPQSRDPALLQVFDRVSADVSDLDEHFHAGPPSATALLDRAAAFMQTDDEYIWPTPSPLLQLVSLPLSLLTLGLANRVLWRRYRFPDHWPFSSPERLPAFPGSR